MLERIAENLSEINVKLAVLNTELQQLSQSMKEHRLEAKVLDLKLDKVELEIAQAQGSVKTLKWMSGLALALPAAIVALFKLYWQA